MSGLRDWCRQIQGEVMRMFKLEKNEEEGEPQVRWEIPIILASYTCLSNFNHQFFTDTYHLSLICPDCGGMMECTNSENLEELGIEVGEKIPIEE